MMTRFKFLLLILGVLLLLSCREKNPTKPPNENRHPQVDIPWPSLADSPWPMHHGNPQSTGRSSALGPQQGAIAWQYNVGEAIGTSIAIGADSTIYFGSEGSNLCALNWDGQLKWKLHLTDQYEQGSSPLVASDGTIYIGTRARMLYAVNPDGSIKWTYSTDDWINNLGMTIGLDGTIYFSTSNFWLHAVNADGTLRWKLGGNYKFQGGETSGIAMSPDGSTLYLGCLGTTEDDTLRGLIAVTTDGSVKWLFPSFACYGTPLVDNAGNIFFGAKRSANETSNEKKQGIFSVSPTGKLRWHFSAQMGPMMDPTIDYNGNIYFATGDSPSSFTLLSLDNQGNVRWRYSSSNVNSIVSSLISDREGTIYFATRSNRLFAFASDGDLKWQINIGEVYCTSPALAYGRILVGTGYHNFGKTIYCIK